MAEPEHGHEGIPHDAAHPCEAHRRCATRLLHVHHNPPTSWTGGHPQAYSVLHHLCPNAHIGEVHAGIDARIRGTYDHRDYGRVARRIIDEAFALAEANGLTPAPTL